MQSTPPIEPSLWSLFMRGRADSTRGSDVWGPSWPYPMVFKDLVVLRIELRALYILGKYVLYHQNQDLALSSLLTSLP